MGLTKCQALMKYTLIISNILIIIFVSIEMFGGLLLINDKSYSESLYAKNSSQFSANYTTSFKNKSIELIINSVIRYTNAILGLWAAIKLHFAVLVIYGISLIISLVVTIIIGLGVEQYSTEIQIESSSPQVYQIIIGVLLALLAFRLACITKSGVDNEIPDIQEPENQQNQCEIV